MERITVIDANNYRCNKCGATYETVLDASMCYRQHIMENEE